MNNTTESAVRLVSLNDKHRPNNSYFNIGKHVYGLAENAKPEIVVCYHAYCNDGTLATYAFYNWVKQFTAGNSSLRVTYVPCQHGQQPPDVKGKGVVILDYAYDPETLFKMEKEAEFILLLDHHKTAAEMYADCNLAFDPDKTQIHICGDNSMSGAGMAWRYFNSLENKSPMPFLVDNVENRDINGPNKDVEYEEAISHYMKTIQVPKGFVDLASVIDSNDVFIAAMDRYDELVRHTADMVKKYASGPATIVMHSDVRIAVMNAPSSIASSLGIELYRQGDVALIYEIKGNSVIASLRSAKVDVEVIAKAYGGGGHAAAAGFKIPLSQFYQEFLNGVEKSVANEPPISTTGNVPKLTPIVDPLGAMPGGMVSQLVSVAPLIPAGAMFSYHALEKTPQQRQYMGTVTAVELYREGPDSTMTHQGHSYSVDKMLALTEHRKSEPVSVRYFEWIFDNYPPTEEDEERAVGANTDFPIIYTQLNSGEYVVLDGFHRLMKAMDKEDKTIMGHYLTAAEIETTKVK